MRAILTYHSIDDSRSPISVSRDVFAAHVRWLASGAVPVRSLADIAHQQDDGSGIAITFDDAFDNFATHAWPLIRDHGLPVTLFVPTAYVGATNDWSTIPGGDMPSLRLLDWPGLIDLANQGVTLGAHTRTHVDLRLLPPSDAAAEITGSIDDIQRATGRRADTFAYPYGFLNDAVVDIVRGSCRYAVTTRLAPLSGEADPHLLPRIDAYFLRGPGRLDEFGSRLFYIYMWTRAAIRRLRGR